MRHQCRDDGPSFGSRVSVPAAGRLSCSCRSEVHASREGPPCTRIMAVQAPALHCAPEVQHGQLEQQLCPAVACHSTSPERMPCVLQARLGLQRGWRRLR